MNLTLNQLVAIFQKISKSHKQLFDFRFGRSEDHLTGEDLQYPCLLVELINGYNSKTEKVNYYNFRMLFCDLENVSSRAKENQTELLSDLTFIANDFKAYLSSPIYAGELIVSDRVQLDYLTEQFRDVVVAVGMTIEIGVWNDSGTCYIPILQDDCFKINGEVILINGSCIKINGSNTNINNNENLNSGLPCNTIGVASWQQASW